VFRRLRLVCRLLLLLLSQAHARVPFPGQICLASVLAKGAREQQHCTRTKAAKQRAAATATAAAAGTHLSHTNTASPALYGVTSPPGAGQSCHAYPDSSIQREREVGYASC
jgi:hypothetical protein